MSWKETGRLRQYPVLGISGFVQRLFRNEHLHVPFIVFVVAAEAACLAAGVLSTSPMLYVIADTTYRSSLSAEGSA